MPEQTTGVVKRIECVYLPATNTEDSANWYIGHLGLKLMRPVHENQAQLGISLIKSKEQGNVNYTEIGGSEQCILTMEVENFKELHNKMKQNGAHVTDIEDNAGCGHNFYAYDPAGNKIDLWSGWPKWHLRFCLLMTRIKQYIIIRECLDLKMKDMDVLNEKEHGLFYMRIRLKGL